LDRGEWKPWDLNDVVLGRGIQCYLQMKVQKKRCVRGVREVKREAGTGSEVVH